MCTVQSLSQTLRISYQFITFSLKHYTVMAQCFWNDPALNGPALNGAFWGQHILNGTISFLNSRALYPACHGWGYKKIVLHNSCIKSPRISVTKSYDHSAFCFQNNSLVGNVSPCGFERVPTIKKAVTDAHAQAQSTQKTQLSATQQSAFYKWMNNARERCYPCHINDVL